MDTNQLHSFITAAETGSFKKAGEQLFISSTAVIKQIGSLEDELGFRLFIRTNHGISLTDQGLMFLDSSRKLLYQCAVAVQNAKDLAVQNDLPIRFGFSEINPYCSVFDQFYYSKSAAPHFNSIIEPISGDFNDFFNEISSLGMHVDVIPYFLGNTMFRHFADEFCLARIPFCAAVPLSNPLSQKEFLEPEDFSGLTLVTLAGGLNDYYQKFNQEICSKAPGVNMKYINFISMQVLNRVVYEQAVLLTGEHLWRAHPLLRLVPVRTEMTLPYGIYYSHEPSRAVTLLLQSFQKLGFSGNPQDAPFVSFRRKNDLRENP